MNHISPLYLYNSTCIIDDIDDFFKVQPLPYDQLKLLYNCICSSLYLSVYSSLKSSAYLSGFFSTSTLICLSFYLSVFVLMFKLSSLSVCFFPFWSWWFTLRMGTLSTASIWPCMGQNTSHNIRFRMGPNPDVIRVYFGFHSNSEITKYVIWHWSVWIFKSFSEMASFHS